jgi:hypothetical protein
MLDTTAKPPEWQYKRNFWQVRRVYMKDRVGDPDRDFEAYAIALADGHSHKEILDAAVRMTCSAIGMGGHYPHIPPLAKFLTSLPGWSLALQSLT